MHKIPYNGNLTALAVERLFMTLNDSMHAFLEQ